MVEEKNKVIIRSVVIVVFLGLIICFMFVDIPIIGINSIKTIMSQRDEIIKEEALLVSKQNNYKSLEENLTESEKSFNSEKAKYEAISDETIEIIKDSNTEEKYSIEYMWIKLGNYASKNNLTLVMVEPGNTNKESSSENSSTSSTSTTSNESVVAKNDNATATSTTTSTTTTTNDTSSTSNSEALKIQVTGSYIDLSDFIFEVENDEELKFKLDNILMEYVSGNTVKTTFDVKNIVINK